MNNQIKMSVAANFVPVSNAANSSLKFDHPETLFLNKILPEKKQHITFDTTKETAKFTTHKQSTFISYNSNAKSFHTKKFFSGQVKTLPCIDVKNFPTIHPDPLVRPFHGLGCSCMPFSSQGFVTPTTTKLGLRNLLRVPTSNVNNYFITRWCSYIFYCSRLKVSCDYPKLTCKSVIEDERVQNALEQTVTEDLQDRSLDEEPSGKHYLALLARYKKQAIVTLNNMKAALSSTLIRITGYVLFKVFNFLFMSVTVTEGQLQIIESAARKNVPLIFVPLHRSHVDYLFVTWVLFNREVAAPIVAAGDNLRIPVFGWLLRGLGGFFIKRKLDSTKKRKDYVYRAVLQSYMSQALHAGYNLEFFIEGGRTRTGKPCLPKGGLLSVIVDAFLSGALPDALIVPIAINYDRILDGHFIREQLGQTKVPESFWRAVRAIAKVLSTSYGHSRIDFSQPFSLKEFFQSQKISLLQAINQQDSLTPPTEHPNPLVPTTPNGHYRSSSIPSSHSLSSNRVMNGNFHSTRSSSSLFGSEVTEEYRYLVKSLASHIVFDAEKCQAIMSTNAISYLLSTLHREGTTLDRLCASVQQLEEDLRLRGRDMGFSGDPLLAAIHALKMLGCSLVNVEGDLDRDPPTNILVRPVTALPNVIELSYYANALSPLYAIDAIVGTSLLSTADCDLWSYTQVNTDCILSHSKLVERSKRLCEILCNEFLFIPPCGSLESRIDEAIQRLVVSRLLVNNAENEERALYRSSLNEEVAQDDVNSTSSDDTFYLLFPTSANLEPVAMVTRGISPLIETYYATALHLSSLIGRPRIDQEYIHDVQKTITTMLQKGTLLYGESIAADPIRNAVKVFEAEAVLESYQQDSFKILFLHKRFESEDCLWPLQEEIGSFRV